MQRLPECLPAGRNSGTHSGTNTQSLPRDTPDASSWSGSRLHRLPKASWQRMRAWQQMQRAFIGSPLLRRWLLLRLRGACSLPRAAKVAESPHSAEDLAEARLARQPADSAQGQLADRAGLPLRLGGMLRPDLQQALGAPPKGALRHQRVHGGSNLPGCSAAGPPGQLLGPGGVAGTAAAP